MDSPLTVSCLEEDAARFKARLFKALADPYRLQIIELLRQGEKCVCEIFPHFGIAQPLASRHLKILKDCGLVKDRKDGNRRIYAITEPEVFKIIDAIAPELVASLSRRAIEQII